MAEETISLVADYDVLRRAMLDQLHAEQTSVISHFQRDHKVLRQVNAILFPIANALNAVNSSEALEEVRERVTKALSVVNEAYRDAQNRFCDGEIVRGQHVIPCRKDLDELGYCSNPACSEWVPPHERVD